MISMSRINEGLVSFVRGNGSGSLRQGNKGQIER